MNRPADQFQRDRFIRELDQNFSVVASAGSGKTRAITERIVSIAQSAHALEWLPTLVVVTYTNRAADEMQQRTREALLRAKVGVDVLDAFSRGFFGTIHSFCLRLLAEYGHHLGLPSSLQLLQTDDALWREFVQQHTSMGKSLSSSQKQALLRLVPAHQLLELGRVLQPEMPSTGCGEFPPFAFEPVFQCVGKGNSARTIQSSQDTLRAWQRQWEEGDGFITLPVARSKAAEFARVWQGCLDPIRSWMRDAAFMAGLEIAQAYRCFRLARGFVTYDDQISLALKLLCLTEPGRMLRAEGYRVILDEAQDTDPSQFGVLLELARPPEADGNWLEDGAHPPRPGHFCMVGDFQQSIFSKRADLSHYRRVHEGLVNSGSAEKLTFSVTFRLDREVAEFVNCTFKHVLREETGQVPFQPLSARPGALSGQVIRVEIQPPESPVKKLAEKMRIEADQLADWIHRTGFEALRAEDWSEVAIICPRIRWFAPLRDALRRKGFAVQVQSERDVRGDSAAYAWLTALLVVLAEPDNSYDVVGVLREVFGLSDDALARFSEGDGTRFHLAIDAQGDVGRVLRQLCELRDRVVTMSLFDAVREVVARTQLIDRLASLPADDFPNPAVEIEALLTRAAAEEAAGGTLQSFASALRKEFFATRETRGTRRGAIQLITGHKAKGSEWQAVIVPALGRKVQSASNHFPHVLRDPRDESLLLALDSEDLDPVCREALQVREQHEFERLLYVALTRAKHTLVLVDDLALFGDSKGIAKTAQAGILQCAHGALNSEAFRGLGTAAELCAETHAAQRSNLERGALETQVDSLPPISATEVAAAQQRAEIFIKRNPSALAHESNSEVPGVNGLDDGSGSPVYGLWWHGFVEQVDWTGDQAHWDTVFERELATSPDPARSRDEWDRLVVQLNPRSTWGPTLCTPSLMLKAEMPFLWKMSETECIEGIMDLVVFDPSKREWLIADWKTNPITPADLQQLKDHYRPQLAAYWRALSDMTGQPVRAALYSTTCGEWLAYESDELRESWAKIAGDPVAVSQALAQR